MFTKRSTWDFEAWGHLVVADVLLLGQRLGYVDVLESHGIACGSDCVSILWTNRSPPGRVMFEKTNGCIPAGCKFEIWTEDQSCLSEHSMGRPKRESPYQIEA